MRNAAFVCILVISTALCMSGQQIPDTVWISLFNGIDLSGWTPKFSGHPVGENYRNTFVMPDGVLGVSYVEYDSFRNEFGHLFYEIPFDYFRLRLEYRFTGPATPGAPDWAYRNNGVMIMSQSPESMLIDQDFPVSVEVQLLGGDGTMPRTTGNVCTPGTYVYIDSTLTKEHCISSNSETYDFNRWVKLEIVVLPEIIVHHIVEGDTVITYFNPEIGGDFLPDGFAQKAGLRPSGRYIALQAESYPTEFRNIMIQPIDNHHK